MLWVPPGFKKGYKEGKASLLRVGGGGGTTKLLFVAEYFCIWLSYSELRRPSCSWSIGKKKESKNKENSGVQLFMDDKS